MLPHRIALVLVLAVLCSGCADRAGTARVTNFYQAHDFAWDVEVDDPQPSWHPSEHKLVCRGANALLILSERTGQATKPRRLQAEGLAEPWNPFWRDEDRVVFGPRPELRRDKEGRVIRPSQGIGSITMGTSANEPVTVEWLAKGPYRPVPWNGSILANLEDLIVALESDNQTRPIDRGFLPVGMVDDVGLAVQETPLFSADLWTGIEGPGRLVVRWRPKEVSEIPAGLQPAWAAWGGLVATQLTVEHPSLPLGPGWWRQGCRVVYLAGPGAAPKTVLEDAYAPAPHPSQRVVAAVRKDGGVVLVDIDGTGIKHVAAKGHNPRWSADGMRLLVEEPDPGKGCTLRVYQFSVHQPAGG